MPLTPGQLVDLKEHYMPIYKDAAPFVSFEDFKKYCPQVPENEPDFSDYLEVYFAVHPVIIRELNHVVKETGSRDISRIFDGLHEEDLNKILEINQLIVSTKINALTTSLDFNKDLTKQADKINTMLNKIEPIYLTPSALLYQHLTENGKLKDRFYAAIASNLNLTKMPNDLHSLFATASIAVVSGNICNSFKKNQSIANDETKLTSLDILNASLGLRYAKNQVAVAAIEYTLNRQKAAPWGRSAIAIGAIAAAAGIGIALLAAGTIIAAPIALPIMIGACIVAAATSLASFIVNRFFNKKAKTARASSVIAIEESENQKPLESCVYEQLKTDIKSSQILPSLIETNAQSQTSSPPKTPKAVVNKKRVISSPSDWGRFAYSPIETGSGVETLFIINEDGSPQGMSEVTKEFLTKTTTEARALDNAEVFKVDASETSTDKTKILQDFIATKVLHLNTAPDPDTAAYNAMMFLVQYFTQAGFGSLIENTITFDRAQDKSIAPKDKQICLTNKQKFIEYNSKKCELTITECIDLTAKPNQTNTTKYEAEYTIPFINEDKSVRKNPQDYLLDNPAKIKLTVAPSKHGDKLGNIYNEKELGKKIHGYISSVLFEKPKKPGEENSSYSPPRLF